MIEPRHLDELAQRVAAGLPTGLRVLKEDLERNLRLALEGAAGRMDLVTREEFDVQAAVLARTRARLQALEARVAELERRLGVGGAGGG